MTTTITTIELEAMLFMRNLTMMSPRHTKVNLDRSAYTILACLVEGRTMSLAELGETLGLDVSTLSRQTTAMLRAGLVERIPDPDGGLARKFRTTALGEARLRDACDAHVRVLQDATADWEPADLDAFADYLERINRGFEQLENRPWPRPGTTT